MDKMDGLRREIDKTKLALKDESQLLKEVLEKQFLKVEVEAEEVKERVKSALSRISVSSQIRRKPLTSMGVFTVAGFVATSRLISTKRRRTQLPGQPLTHRMASSFFKELLRSQMENLAVVAMDRIISQMRARSHRRGPLPE